jgi:inosine/xanthosine triphosphatase
MADKTIIVASRNPVKIAATHRGFQRMFPDQTFTLEGIAAVSGVSRQPISSQETLRGALNRVETVARKRPDADYWVGIEGGVEESGAGMTAFAWVFIRSRETTGKARTGTFLLPERVARLVREGNELGEADDIIFGRVDSKREEGAIGLLTGNVIDRTALYAHGVILALVPFRNVGMYGKG